MQTTDGYLWLGTRFGLVRFDGIGFRTFDRSGTPELAEDNCFGLTEDRDGALWMLTWDYAIRYRERQWQSFRLADGTFGWRNWGICASRQGGVWVAARHGLFQFIGEKFVRYGPSEGLVTEGVFGVWEDPSSGVVWVGTAEGLRRREVAGRPFTMFSPTSDPLNAGWRTVCRDRAGAIWTGHYEGLCRWEEGGPARWFTRAHGLAHAYVALVREDAERNLWVITGDGSWHRFTGERFVRHSLNVDLTRDNVTCVYEDREGNQWVGTEFGGLKRLQARQMGVVGTADGLLHENVISIAECRNGRLLFGVTGGLTELHAGRVASVVLPSGPSAADNNVTAILEASDGTVWVGTKYFGLNRLIDGQLAPFALMREAEADQVNALYEDRAGRLWVGTKEGLYQIQAGQVRRFTPADGLPSGNVRGILQDRQGDLWLGTYGGGIARWREGQFTAYGKAEGLSDLYAWLVFEDSQGTLWVGTEHGLNRFKDGRLTALGTKHGLFDEVINGMLEDSQQNFWIGCNRGIFRVARRELEAVADGRATTVQSIAYGTSDGMASSETNGEKQPSACRTRAGLFWFPTLRGAVFFRPEAVRNNPLPPPVVIEEVMVDGEMMSPIRAARLPPGRGRAIEFHYTGNSLVAPEKVRYRYWLEGRDRAWTEVGNRRVAIYTDLRPGEYRFHVTACNNHGLWNPGGATFALHLAPYFHQTRPFYVLCALVVVLAGFGLHQLRVRVLRRIQLLEQQHALDLERARIARDMHDELGATLARIGLLCELAERDLPHPTAVSAYIRKIMTSSRELFRSLDEIVWAVNPRHDSLESLVAYSTRYAQDYLQVAGIRCRLDVPSTELPQPLSSEERHHLFLTLKEALTNTVKHAAATEVHIRLAVEEGELSVSIEDNGRGFVPGEAGLTRNGLANMKQRVLKIGGHFELESQPGRGTAVRWRLRLRSDGG
jgi:ligand-binding sensor domain-containing protein/signal transduction histidine kinase